MSELNDFTAAPAWLDALGGVVTQRQVMDYRGSLSDFSAGAPWTPLDTADEWVQRIDSGKLADVINSIVAPDDLTTEHIERMTRAAYAAIAALPDLMGGAA